MICVSHVKRTPTGRAAVRRVLAALASAMLAATSVACDSPTTARPNFAYDPTTLSNGMLYRWANGQKLRVWADLADSTRGVNLGLSVRLAIARWNDIPAFAEYELVLVSNAAEAQIIIYDRVRPMPVRAGTCPFEPRAAVGYTYFCPKGRNAERLVLTAGSPSTVSVVIRVDDTQVSGQARYDAIVAHELGHALGIGAHSSVAGDLMFGLPTATFPTGRDAQTLQYVLGARADIIL